MKKLALGSHDNLCFLDVSDNHLATLHGLGHTPQLLQLTATGNRVARVSGVTACPHLQRLTLDSNLLINSKASGAENRLYAQKFSSGLSGHEDDL